MTYKILAESMVFGGKYIKYEHGSIMGCSMKVSCFIPSGPGLKSGLMYLSGLTCNEDNFITKAGAIRSAVAHNLILICPDTSPRGLNVEGEADSWDFGLGAGYYLDATVPKWSGYQMYSYILKELLPFVKSILPLDKLSIFGHSMGGHGALSIAFKNPDLFVSVSAFAPIAGQTAFSGYLQSRDEWAQYDSTLLASSYSGRRLSVLVDQGTSDSFYTQGTLMTDEFIKVASQNPALDLTYKLRPGYDHGYWYIQTFVDEHVSFHANQFKSIQ